MYDFAIRGTIAGFFSSQDGSKMYLKILPEKLPTNLERDEKPGPLSVLVGQSLVKNFAMNSLVLVRGKESVRMRDWKAEDGRMKALPRFVHEAESIEVVKTAEPAKV